MKETNMKLTVEDAYRAGYVQALIAVCDWLKTQPVGPASPTIVALAEELVHLVHSQAQASLEGTPNADAQSKPH